jgi:glycosyltransferase involved in cell wall biosynthesis
MLENVTPLILTYNEAPNIGRTVEQLHWARDIVVVDSFSDDDTVEIVSTFPQVRVYQRGFDSHEKQWNFGLKETGINSEWVLALDADYVLTDEFLAEVEALSPDQDVKGYRAKLVYCVDGKRLISGIYPPVSVLYRRRDASYVQDGHTHKLVLNGRVESLHTPILHDDRKSLAHWLRAQSRYTKLEADKLLSSEPENLSWTDRVRRWRIVAPPAMLFYCLFIRGGILDGWAGFYYAFQRSLAELMLSLYLLEHDLSGSEKPSPQRHREHGGGTENEIPNPKFEIRNS